MKIDSGSSKNNRIEGTGTSRPHTGEVDGPQQSSFVSQINLVHRVNLQNVTIDQQTLADRNVADNEPPLRHLRLGGTVLKSGLLLFLGKGITQVCSFVRNVIVARVIGVENFGIAATFSITISILDMLGSISADKLLIQARDGNVEKFQSTAHAMQALRGCISGLLIVACAKPLAELFGTPEATWAFRYLALVPILRGLVHLDPQRIQRELKYGPSVGLDIAQQLIPTLLAWPLALWVRDYSAVLWLLAVQSAIAAIGSFIVSRRPYRWHWNSEYFGRFLNFGWPLIINGVLLFGVYQGDRFLIASAKKLFGADIYSLKELGVFSVAVSLTLTPMVALGSISSSLMLPLFSGLQTNPVELRRQYAFCSEVVGLLSGFFAIPLILAGGWVVTTVYGTDYKAAGAFIGWMAAAQAIRMARFTPSMTAMAFADTTNAMISNLIRSSALIATLWVVSSGGTLKWVAVSGFFGELAGLVVCLWKLKRNHQIPGNLGIKPAMLLVAMMGLAGLIAAALPSPGPAVNLLLITVLTTLFAGSMLLFFPELRSLTRLLHSGLALRKPNITGAAIPVSRDA